MTIIANSQDGSRQHYSAQGLTDATGFCLIQFTPPISQFWTGGVTVYDSADQVQWMVATNGIVVDVVQGAATTSSIQLGPSDVLTLQCRNGIAGQVYHATLTVVATPQDNSNLIIPAHDPYHQPFAVVNLGSFQPGVIGGTIFSVPIPAGINSVLVVGNMQLNDHLRMEDLPTGTVYYDSNTELGGNFNPVWVDVLPNSTLHLTWSPASGPSQTINLTGIAEPSPVDNTSQTAVFSRDKYDGLPVSSTNNNITAGNVVTVLNAPPAGNVYDIKALVLNVNTSAFSASQALYMRGLSSGAFFLGSYAQATGIFINQSYDKFYLNEGIQVVNSTTLTATGFVHYRTIPIWYL